METLNTVWFTAIKYKQTGNMYCLVRMLFLWVIYIQDCIERLKKQQIKKNNKKKNKNEGHPKKRNKCTNKQAKKKTKGHIAKQMSRQINRKKRET